MESKPKSLTEKLADINNLDTLLFSLGQLLMGKELEAASLVLGVLVIKRKNDNIAQRNYLGSPDYAELQKIFPEEIHAKIVALVGEPIYRPPRDYEKSQTKR